MPGERAERDDDRSNRRSREPALCHGHQGRSSVWDWIADPIWASGHAPRQQAGHVNAVDHPSEISPMLLHPRGRSLIAPPVSTAFLLSPCRDHGSLRSRRMPPQHLVRSTGAAMSTTGSHGRHAAQRPPSQLACTLAPVGNSQPRDAPARSTHAPRWLPGQARNFAAEPH